MDKNGNLHIIATPALILDRERLSRNQARITQRIRDLGVTFRPHAKTGKSIDVMHHLDGPEIGPITVSTLAEAEYFANAGVNDMIYAVGIGVDKIPRVAALKERGINIAVLLDSVGQAKYLVQARQRGLNVPEVFIEIDCDGHRGGLLPSDPRIIEIASVLSAGIVVLRGVLAHAGESYSCRGGVGLVEAAEIERAATVSAAEAIRAAGFSCPEVSVGSTPTAHFAQDLKGVTEVRAGVYMFFDLVMRGVGVCSYDDIAVSVLATVIGHRPEKGWVLIDAGWMALSRDRGTARQPVDQGYGVVCDITGKPIDDLIVADASQEHGIVAVRSGSGGELPDLPLGTRLRILPNHACATSSQHDSYMVVDGADPTIKAYWPRMRGW